MFVNKRLYYLRHELINCGFNKLANNISVIIKICKKEEPTIIDSIDNTDDGSVMIMNRMTQIPEDYEILTPILNDTILDEKSGNTKIANKEKLFRFYFPDYLGGGAQESIADNVKDAWKRLGYIYGGAAWKSLKSWEAIEQTPPAARQIIAPSPSLGQSIQQRQNILPRMAPETEEVLRQKRRKEKIPSSPITQDNIEPSGVKRRPGRPKKIETPIEKEFAGARQINEPLTRAQQFAQDFIDTYAKKKEKI